MLVSLKWLSQYVDLQGLEPEVLAEKITRSGIEVEGVHHLSDGLKKLMVGQIKELKKHPDYVRTSHPYIAIGRSGHLYDPRCR